MFRPPFLNKSRPHLNLPLYITTFGLIGDSEACFSGYDLNKQYFMLVFGERLDELEPVYLVYKFFISLVTES